MAKFHKSREELEDQLREQIEALRSAAAGYDKGEKWQSGSIATRIYALFHDGGKNSKSLLGQLNLKNSMKMCSSMHVEEGKSKDGWELVAIQATPLLHIEVEDQRAEFGPVFDSVPSDQPSKWIAFSRWYDECIFQPQSNIDLSRKRIIVTVRNQDGGAHVDSAITDVAYHEFKKFGDPLFSMVPAGPSGEPIFSKEKAISQENNRYG